MSNNNCNPMCLTLEAPAKPLWRDWLSWVDAQATVGFEWLIAVHERSRSRRQLLSLDDRLLKDIGIDRATAQAEGQKSPWRAWPV